MEPHTPFMIGVDWGTTTFRAYLLSCSGEVLDRVTSVDGVTTRLDNNWGSLINSHCGEWLGVRPDLSITMCGMIGSRHGWVEVPYLESPVDALAISAATVCIDVLPNCIQIIPGVRAPSYDEPDVMRGEETIVIGAVAAGAPKTALFCIPGTHSKWISVVNGRIGAFSTYLTGELFALLRSQSTLASVISNEALATAKSVRCFEEGLVLSSGKAGLLKNLFTLRSRALLNNESDYVLVEALSGVLIGTELTSALESIRQLQGPVILVASGTLLERYKLAMALMGIQSEVIESEVACAKGLYLIKKLHDNHRSGNAKMHNRE